MNTNRLVNFFEKIKYTPKGSNENIYDVEYTYKNSKKYVQLRFFSKKSIYVKDLEEFLNHLKFNFKLPYSIVIKYDSFEYNIKEIRDYWIFLTKWLPKLFNDLRSLDINSFKYENNDFIITSWNKSEYSYLNLNKDKFREALHRFGFTDLNIVVILKEKKVLNDDLNSHKTVVKKIKNSISDGTITLFEPEIKSNYLTLSLEDFDNGVKKIATYGTIVRMRKNVSKHSSIMYNLNVSNYKGSATLKSKWNTKRISNIENLKEKDVVKVYGKVIFDSFLNRKIIEIDYIAKIESEVFVKKSNSNKKRIEFHSHTKMSVMDSLVDAKKLVERASVLGQKSITITDHNSAQAFPEAYYAGKKHNIKINYGVELDVVDYENSWVVKNPIDRSINKSKFVFFDLETTGLNALTSDIIEFGAVKYENGEMIDKLQFFVKPENKISSFTTKLTGITQDMLDTAIDQKSGILKFKEFIEDSILVAHNAEFDYSFIKNKYLKHNLGEVKNTIVDTLKISQAYIKSASYRLGNIAKKLGIEFDTYNAHRADYDAAKLAEIYYSIESKIRNDGIKNFIEAEKFLKEKISDRFYSYHLNIVARNQKGIDDLYKLISLANTEYLTSRGIKVPLKYLLNNRENFLIGSGCSNGFIWKAATSDYDYLVKTIEIMDYIEIQSIENFNHLIKKESITEKEVKETINLIIEESSKKSKILIATSDVHLLDSKDVIPRKVIVNAKAVGGKRHPLFNYSGEIFLPNQTFRNTDQMLEEFNWLPNDIKEKIVVENTHTLDSKIENVTPLKNKLYKPKFDNASKILFDYINKKFKELYGEKPDTKIVERYNQEYEAIKHNNFDVFYYLAHIIVKESISNNYLVGSRGSVGSSFIAFIADISEVNPLPAHYVCPKCYNVIWNYDHSLGIDLERKNCSKCNVEMKRDGFSIPFETFLGFTGNKVPDIDLNFSGVYQSEIHKFTENLFPKGNVFRAGTISTIASKTAYSLVKSYFEDVQDYTNYSSDTVSFIASKLEGVKRTTGSHPGGLIIIPNNMNINEFTPYNYPGDDKSSDMKTTHFEYHAIHDNLLKLDLLGHDDPTVLRDLFDYTKINPVSVDISDENIKKLFQEIEILGINKIDFKYASTGLLGIPEFGTEFARGLVRDASPKSFADLVRISGLAHGTYVWTNNAKELVKEKTATLKEVISCRDDIMNYLISKGIEKPKAFSIMELVRKGKLLEESDNELMLDKSVPKWYVDSMKKIQYLFPKAHASAYVLMALKISWYKIYEPLAFYASYFKNRVDSFDLLSMIDSKEAIERKIDQIDSMIKDKISTPKDLEVKKSLLIALEMMYRGFKFEKMDIKNVSDIEWKINKENKTLTPPLSSIDGLGKIVASNIVKARDQKEFESVEDLKLRGKIGNATVKLFEPLGLVDNLESKQTKQKSIFEI